MSTVATLNPTFAPAMRVINAITKAETASITTSFDHSYITGTVVRLYIPLEYGMQQAQHAVAPITVTGTDSFTMLLRTVNFDAFSVPGSPGQCAQVVPIGEVNSILTAAFVNIL